MRLRRHHSSRRWLDKVVNDFHSTFTLTVLSLIEARLSNIRLYHTRYFSNATNTSFTGWSTSMWSYGDMDIG
jgi:hypothetical protein